MPAVRNNALTENLQPLDRLLSSGAAARCADGLLVKAPRTGATLLICALTDLDGTANDEHVREDLRLATIAPARDAFAVLAASGVVTGICTARSSGEARHYQRELNVTGPLISENGAVVRFPDGSREVFGDLGTLAAAVNTITARLRRPVPHSLDWAGLEAAWERERRGESPALLGHPDRESLRRAAEREASCFLVGLTPEEKRLVAGLAGELGLACFGELLHLIARGANKGRAMEALNAHLLHRPPEQGLKPDRVAQIVFGNGENDLPLFASALRAGGAAVLVGDATTEHGFHFDPMQHPVPEGTISLRGVSHGHAIRQSLPLLREFFAARYGVVFPW